MKWLGCPLKRCRLDQYVELLCCEIFSDNLAGSASHTHLGRTLQLFSNFNVLRKGEYRLATPLFVELLRQTRAKTFPKFRNNH